MKTIVCYCDGSALNNGQPDKKQGAGSGVYFPHYPRLSFGKRLETGKKTNNRAELFAIIIAIEFVSKNKDKFNNEEKIKIKSDSKYCIDAITRWSINWKVNGWMTKGGTSVENKDLLVRILDLIRECNYQISFKHVKGHQREPKDKNTKQWAEWYGNKMADETARLYSHLRKSRVKKW